MILSDCGAFSQIIRCPNGTRPGKPRISGITMVMDKGLGYEQQSDIFDVASAYIDLIKFGFGTSCLYPRHILQQKLSLAQSYSIRTCPGGTLGEIALAQNVFDQYLARCAKLGFSAIEVSDGTIELDQQTRHWAIKQAKSLFPLVVSEVGKKLDNTSDIRSYVKQVITDLDAGSDYVTIEGRESGEGVGIYKSQGEVDSNLLDTFISELPEAARTRIIWEAPKKNQQVELITRFGNLVNLGNIQPSEVMSVECLRLGLRADTFIQTLTKEDL